MTRPDDTVEPSHDLSQFDFLPDACLGKDGLIDKQGYIADHDDRLPAEQKPKKPAKYPIAQPSHDYVNVSQVKSASQILDDVGIEAICAKIEAGESQSEILTSLGVSVGTFYRWLNGDSERTARAAKARTASAEGWMDRGLKELEAIPKNGTKAEIARARELVQHCRKMAAIRNPTAYGDKLDISGNIEVTARDPDDLGVALKVANLLSTWRSRAIQAGEEVPFIELPAAAISSTPSI